jgi:UDP-N-acetylglucosamine 2-epimerase (non-hydrolysing)
MKVTTVVGTRPEIIKLSRVMPALDAAVDHTVIHTGQNYDPNLSSIFFEQMKIRKPDVQMYAAESTPIKSVAAMMAQLENLFTGTLPGMPDALLILGDTNSCVAAAYVAKRLKIPLFHLEAGNRCFDERVPEELNRRVVDHLSDVNMPYSERARENLMREGIPTDRVIKTGSPMNEVLDYYQYNFCQSQVLSQLNLTSGKYFVASIHRDENVSQFGMPYCVLDAVARKYNMRVIVSTHPRVEASVNKTVASPLVEFHKPFGFFDYIKLQRNALCTLSDSGTITEESSILGFPALNLREAHERPEGSEEGNVIMTGMNVDRVLEAIPVAQQPSLTPIDYCPKNVSNKVVRTILSMTDYVNRNVWRK